MRSPLTAAYAATSASVKRRRSRSAWPTVSNVGGEDATDVVVVVVRTRAKIARRPRRMAPAQIGIAVESEMNEQMTEVG